MPVALCKQVAGKVCWQNNLLLYTLSDLNSYITQERGPSGWTFEMLNGPLMSPGGSFSNFICLKQAYTWGQKCLLLITTNILKIPY